MNKTYTGTFYIPKENQNTLRYRTARYILELIELNKKHNLDNE